MAKKVNPFASDFEGLNRSADDKVLALLKNAENSEDPAKTAPAEVSRPPLPEVTQPLGAEEQMATSAPGKRKKVAKPKSSLKWGKPVAHFNTRIPESMAGLLDDLVYKLKKRGQPKSKQDLAQEALSDLLKKHSLL